MRRLIFICILLVVAGTQVPGQPLQRGSSVKQTSFNDSLDDKLLLRYIWIMGNKVTRRKVVTREMNVAEGMLIDKDSLADIVELNHQRLHNLAIFTDVDILIDTIDKHTVDWVIKLKEQWYIMPEVAFKLADRNFNVWWDEHRHDIRRANIGVTLVDNNFRGNLEKLSAVAQVGYTQKFGMEYYRPYIDKKQQHGFGLSFFVAKNEETYYITDSNKLIFVKTPGRYIIRQFEAAGRYVFRPGYAYRHQLELRYRDHEVSDTLAKLNKDYYNGGATQMKMLEFVYRFEVNKVDNWNYPLKGLKAVGYAVGRAGIMGFKFQSYCQAEVGYFNNPAGRLFTSTIFRGRLTVPEKQPYAYRYAMGAGSEYVRGYEYYVIDGSQYGLLRNNIKYELLNFRIRNIPIRYLPVIPLRLYPKIYVDAGYVSNRFSGNSFLNNRLLYSAGAGFDIISAYNFKIRVEYTINHLGQKGLFLHIASE